MDDLELITKSKNHDKGIPCQFFDEEKCCPFENSWEKAPEICEKYKPTQIIGWGIYVNRSPEHKRISYGLYPSKEKAMNYIDKCNQLNGLFVISEELEYIPSSCGLCPWYDDSFQLEPNCRLMNSARYPRFDETPNDCPCNYFK